MMHHRLVRNVIIRVAGLATALFIGLVMSAEGALAVRPRDPGALGGPAASVGAPAAPLPPLSFELFGQPWQVALATAVVALAVIALIIAAARRHRIVSA